MTELTDEVVAAARTGDRDALHTVYAVLAPRVLGYLRGKGVADPEGVTNDVFLAVLPRLEHLAGGAEGLRRLTFSVAHARMVDDHRRRARSAVVVSWDAESDHRTSASAADEAEVSLSTARVRAVLDRLPADQREVLLLRVVADLSIEQVAEVMGRSSGAVKQLQRRGLIALREILGDGQVTR